MSFVCIHSVTPTKRWCLKLLPWKCADTVTDSNSTVQRLTFSHVWVKALRKSGSFYLFWFFICMCVYEDDFLKWKPFVTEKNAICALWLTVLTRLIAELVVNTYFQPRRELAIFPITSLNQYLPGQKTFTKSSTTDTWRLMQDYVIEFG